MCAHAPLLNAHLHSLALLLQKCRKLGHGKERMLVFLNLVFTSLSLVCTMGTNVSQFFNKRLVKHVGITGMKGTEKLEENIIGLVARYNLNGGLQRGLEIRSHAKCENSHQLLPHSTLPPLQLQIAR